MLDERVHLALFGLAPRRPGRVPPPRPGQQRL